MATEVDIPLSQGSQGLPHAAPSVAQHSDLKVPPFIFISQRPSWMFIQHVAFRESVKATYRFAHIEQK